MNNFITVKWEKPLVTWRGTPVAWLACGEEIANPYKPGEIKVPLGQDVNISIQSDNGMSFIDLESTVPRSPAAIFKKGRACRCTFTPREDMFLATLSDSQNEDGGYSWVLKATPVKDASKPRIMWSKPLARMGGLISEESPVPGNKMIVIVRNGEKCKLSPYYYDFNTILEPDDELQLTMYIEDGVGEIKWIKDGVVSGVTVSDDTMGTYVTLSKKIAGNMQLELTEESFKEFSGKGSYTWTIRET